MERRGCQQQRASDPVPTAEERIQLADLYSKDREEYKHADLHVEASSPPAAHSVALRAEVVEEAA